MLDVPNIVISECDEEGEGREEDRNHLNVNYDLYDDPHAGQEELNDGGAHWTDQPKIIEPPPSASDHYEKRPSFSGTSINKRKRGSIDNRTQSMGLKRCSGELGSNSSMASRMQKDGSRGSFSEEAKNLKKRASHMIIELPAAGLRKIKNTDGVNSLQRETQHFVGITTLHGPLRVYRGKRYSMWFWASMMGLSLVLLMWQIGALLSIYTTMPIVSEVSFLVSQEGMDFPMITVCNFNPIRRSYIKKLNKTGDFSEILLDYLIETNYEVHALFAQGNETLLNEGNMQLLEYTKVHSNFTIKSFFRDGGFLCDEILKICSFAGVEFECCKHAQIHYTDLGKCFMVNTSALEDSSMKRQTAAGVNSGLQIILDVHLEEQFDGTGDEPQPIFANALENGFRYYVHERDSIPHVVSEGISVSPGATVYSALTASNFELLDHKSWGNCTREWPKDYMTPLDYSSANCAALCKAKYFEEKCGCSPFVYNIDETRRTCTPYEAYQCILKNMATFNGNGRPQLKLPPCNHCTVSCSSWGYTAFNSYGQGLSNGAVKWIQNKNSEWTSAHVRSNFVAINVFFRDLTFTKYTQRPGISLVEILSDIGGNMGMFMGMSVLTFVETIIFLTKITWIAISKKRREYMFNKKKQEERKEKEMEETITQIRDTLHNIDSVEDTSRLEKLRRRLEDNFTRSKPVRMNRIRPVAPVFAHTERKESKVERKLSKAERKASKREEDKVAHAAREAEKEAQRKKFLSEFYANALYGDGRADIEDENTLPRDESVLELKINMDEVERQLEHGGDGDVTVVAPSQCEYVTREARAKSIEERRNRTPSFYLNLPDDLFHT